MKVIPLGLSLLFACAVSAQRQPVAAGERTIQVYDLGELVAGAAAEPEAAVADPVPPNPLRDLPLLSSMFDRWAPAVGPAGPKRRLREIADFLREFTEPRLGDLDEIQVVGERSLVVLATAEQHAWIVRWLTLTRSAPEELLDVNVAFYALTPAAYAAHLAPLLARAPRPTQVRVDPNLRAQSLLLAPGAETEAFLTALAKADGVESMQSPRVLVRMRESASVRVGEEISYIKDFELEIGHPVIAHPVVGTVWDGLAFSIIGSTLLTGQLGLQVEAMAADLTRPIPTFETKLGVGAPVTIQLPQVRIARLRAAVELPKDHIVLFSVADATEKPMVVVVRVRTIAPEGGTGK